MFIGSVIISTSISSYVILQSCVLLGFPYSARQYHGVAFQHIQIQEQYIHFLCNWIIHYFL